MEYLKNNSFISRGLYTLMLATYIRHIWVCSILITLNGDIEKNPESKPSSCEKFPICHGNLNHISVHNFMKNISNYVRITQPIISTFHTYLKLILIHVFLKKTTI